MKTLSDINDISIIEKFILNPVKIFGIFIMLSIKKLCTTIKEFYKKHTDEVKITIAVILNYILTFILLYGHYSRIGLLEVCNTYSLAMISILISFMLTLSTMALSVLLILILKCIFGILYIVCELMLNVIKSFRHLINKIISTIKEAKELFDEKEKEYDRRRGVLNE